MAQSEYQAAQEIPQCTDQHFDDDSHLKTQNHETLDLPTLEANVLSSI